MGVILAAGSSTRMGRDKAGLLWEGERLDRRALRLLREAAGATRLCLVVARGRDDPEAARGPGVERLVHPCPEEGQSSSVRLAARAAGGAGLVLLPVDHAPVLERCVELLARRFRQRPAGIEIVVPRCDGRRGHPAFFGPAAAAELAGLDDGEPAHQVVRRDPSRVEEVEVDDAAVVLDLDRPEDLARLQRRREGRDVAASRPGDRAR